MLKKGYDYFQTLLLFSLRIRCLFWRFNEFVTGNRLETKNWKSKRILPDGFAKKKFKLHLCVETEDIYRMTEAFKLLSLW